MEKIEQEINQLTTQIEEVSVDVKTIKDVLKKDFEDWSQQEKRDYGNEEEEARKQLRSEKEQLLIEKEQLRRKEERLRIEKEQLRRKEERLRIEKEQLLEQKTILMKKEAGGMFICCECKWSALLLFALLSKKL